MTEIFYIVLVCNHSDTEMPAPAVCYDGRKQIYTEIVKERAEIHARELQEQFEEFYPGVKYKVATVTYEKDN